MQNCDCNETVNFELKRAHILRHICNRVDVCVHCVYPVGNVYVYGLCTVCTYGSWMMS